jgi:hypothetical protein
VGAFAKNRQVSREKRKGSGSGLKVNGKILAMMSLKGNFVAKFSKETVDDLISNGNGERFDPDIESNEGVVRRSGLLPSAGRPGIRLCSHDQKQSP